MWYSWKYLDDIRPFVKGPMLVKGIVTPEDAKMCVERGYDGLIVSNHGGRSMDGGPSTLEVLPEIVDAVGGKIPVLIDSGFRRGSDVFKAIAIGASAVCLGRAPRWGLGAFGPQGVQRLLEIVQAEFREAMAKTGRTTLAVGRSQRAEDGFAVSQLRLPRREDLVNVLEFEEAAKLSLPPAIFATIAGERPRALRAHHAAPADEHSDRRSRHDPRPARRHALHADPGRAGRGAEALSRRRRACDRARRVCRQGRGDPQQPIERAGQRARGAGEEPALVLGLRG